MVEGCPSQADFVEQTVLLCPLSFLFSQCPEDNSYHLQRIAAASFPLVRLCLRKRCGFLGDAKGAARSEHASSPQLRRQFVCMPGQHVYTGLVISTWQQMSPSDEHGHRMNQCGLFHSQRLFLLLSRQGLTEQPFSPKG